MDLFRIILFIIWSISAFGVQILFFFAFVEVTKAWNKYEKEQRRMWSYGDFILIKLIKRICYIILIIGSIGLFIINIRINIVNTVLDFKVLLNTKEHYTEEGYVQEVKTKRGYKYLEHYVIINNNKIEFPFWSTKANKHEKYRIEYLPHNNIGISIKKIRSN